MKKTVTILSVLGALSVAVSVQAQGHSDHAMMDHSAMWQHASAATTVSVQHCWIRNIPTPAPSAGYFEVFNNGNETVQLLAAESDRYGDIMLHQTVTEDGLAKMRMADKIDIAAGSQLDFVPGGYHAMLEKPSTPVSVGEHVTMRFLFSNQQVATAQCEVRATGARNDHSH